MSLVNDALRRAKEVDKASPSQPPTQLQFQPMQPQQLGRQSVGWMIPTVLVLVALVALLFFWQWTRGRSDFVPQARALTPPPALVQPIASPQPPPPAPAPQASVAAPDPTPAPVPLAAAAPETNSAAPTTIAALAAEPPKPPPLRLQAIVYNPKRPSAVINGKTLFLGEKIGDARLVAIDQESATLLCGGKTNTLTLAE